MPNGQYNDLIIGAVASSIFMVLIFTFITVLLFRHRKSKFETARTMEKMERDYERALLKTQLDIQEQTFHDISQELHDNVGQILTLAKLTLNTVGPVLPEPANEKITNSKDLVSKAISDLRNFSKSLNTEMIKEVGLNEAIRREVEIIEKTGRYEAIFVQNGAARAFDKEKELIVFRIFQEVINNVINHSQATSLKVYATYDAKSFCLDISDNGKGFDVSSLSATNQKFGLGLRNMRNRASLIGSEFKIDSVPGTGTAVRITIPFTTK